MEDPGFISDIRPPSPLPAFPSSTTLAFDGPYDFKLPHTAPRAGALTPSYNGSFHGSPYTALSDLSIDDGLYEHQQDILYDRPHGHRPHEYDPADYDVPLAPAGSLLAFSPNMMNTLRIDGAPQLSLTGPDADPTSPPAQFDHSSPSSNGAGDDHSVRSRASSISSNPHQSPRLHVQQNFESLSFDPSHSHQSWAQQSLDRRTSMSPPHHPQSPPQLLIPGASNPTQTMPHINAPAGDGMGGPKLTIVPATPVGGGANAAHAQPSYGQPVEDAQSVATGANDDPNRSWAPAPVSEAQFTFPQPSDGDPSSLFNAHHSPSLHPQGLPQQQQQQQQQQQAYLGPRMRSHSDSSPQQPAWVPQPRGQPRPFEDMYGAHAQGGSSGPSASLHPHQQQQQRPSMANAAFASFGPPTTDLGPPQRHLSPGDVMPMRRARSENGRPTHSRLVQSEDIRMSPSMGAPSAFGFNLGGGDDGFLRPEGAVQGISRGHRRSSSGGSSHSHSRRTSPYPSPHASPLALPSELDPYAQQQHAAEEMSLVNAADAGLFVSTGGQSSASLAQQNVTKQNVTTHATKDASEKRRKVEANFKCPVPGCESTFTRHFNLKGHMRSHNEERPFKCKWPGCQKSFARQHDCKRHENLHLNIRPFTCEGCKKTFARMDALNRHLRSEGGADCQRLQAELTPADAAAYSGMGQPHPGLAPAHGQVLKDDPDMWHSGGLLM